MSGAPMEHEDASKARPSAHEAWRHAGVSRLTRPSLAVSLVCKRRLCAWAVGPAPPPISSVVHASLSILGYIWYWKLSPCTTEHLFSCAYANWFSSGVCLVL